MLENQKNTKEEIKPVVDWSLYAKWHRYLAKNECGNWYGFSTTPKLAKTTWVGSIHCERIPQEYAPTFTGDWKDSLFERPL
jgi:hypothetical protein